MIKFLGLLVICFLIFGVIPAEGTSTSITSQPGGGTNLQSNLGGLGIGYVKVGTAEVMTLMWHPDFKIGAWGVGGDINLKLSDKKVEGLDTAVLRYVEYDDYSKGLRYGVLDNVTIGHGLIMKLYTTRRGDQVLLSNDQTGAKGYIDMDKYVLRGMLTRSNIYFVRVEERINPLLTLGQYYVADPIGRTIVQTSGASRTFPSVSAIGLDAVMPLPNNWQGYAEAGQLVNHGTGLAAGLSWAFDAMVASANFQAEYRLLDKGFVPGYFGPDYENNPVDLVSAEASGKAKNGYLAQLGVNALGLASLTAIYESYQDSNSSLAADLSAKFLDQLSVRGYYKQPNFVDYRSISLEQGAIMGADVSYKINPLTNLITHYKQAFNPTTGQVESSQYYEIGFNF